MIQDDFTLTAAKKRFLQMDNKSRSDRIVIFVCDISIKLLAMSEEWYMDGTFKEAPKGNFIKNLIVNYYY